MIDWLGLAGLVAGGAGTVYGRFKASRAKLEKEARKAAERAKEEAFEAAMDKLAEVVNHAAANVEDRLMAKFPGMAGAALLNELAEQRAAAIVKGKEFARQKFLAELAGARAGTIPSTERITKPEGIPEVIP